MLSLSISTVSKSLLGHSDISEDTKNRVIEMAKKMNYQPNLFGKGLRTHKTLTIGVIIPNIVLHYSSIVLKGIIEASKDKGYRVIVSQSGHHYQDEKDALITMLNSNVDGILLAISRESQNVEHILDAAQFIPIVLFDKISLKVPLTKVVVDEENGAYAAVEHLLAQGRKNILIIREISETSNSENRFRGYAKALSDNGIPINKNLIGRCDNMTVTEGFALTESIIKRKIEFDGVFGATDNVAIGAIKALKKNGFSIPENVAVIGFSNGSKSTIIEPNLSTIDQHGYELGKLAAEYLIEEIREDLDFSANKTIELKTKLIVRESSKV